MRDVYQISGNSLTNAERILKKEHGFCPDRNDLVKYWKPLGYVHPNLGGSRQSENDRRYKENNISEAARRRIIAAWDSREEAGHVTIDALSKIFQIPKQFVKEIIKQDKRRIRDSASPLEERLR